MIEDFRFLAAAVADAMLLPPPPVDNLPDVDVEWRFVVAVGSSL